MPTAVPGCVRDTRATTENAQAARLSLQNRCCHGSSFPCLSTLGRLISTQSGISCLTLMFETVQDQHPHRSPAELKNQTNQRRLFRIKAISMTKTFIYIMLVCFAIIACGTAFAQQEKLASGPYKGPMAPMVSPDMPDVGGLFYTNLVVNPCRPLATTAPITVSSCWDRTIASRRDQRNGSLIRSLRPKLATSVRLEFAITDSGSAQPLRPSLRMLSIAIMVIHGPWHADRQSQ